MGKFEIWEEISGNKYGRKLGESQNRMVYDGIEMMSDFIFGIETWFSGAAGYDGTVNGSTHWHPYRYVALGYSADDNDGFLQTNNYALTGAAGAGANQTGGTGISGACVATGSNFAHFPSLEDSYMSSLDVSKINDNVGTGLFYKLADRTIRTARTVTIEATFNTDSNADNGDEDTIPTGTKIREMGIFLGIPTGSIAPSTTRSDRPSTMLFRSVRYQVSGGYIEDNPITVGTNNLTVRYTYGDVA